MTIDELKKMTNKELLKVKLPNPYTDGMDLIMIFHEVLRRFKKKIESEELYGWKYPPEDGWDYRSIPSENELGDSFLIKDSRNEYYVCEYEEVMERDTGAKEPVFVLLPDDDNERVFMLDDVKTWKRIERAKEK